MSNGETAVLDAEIIVPEVTRQAETSALAKRYTSEAEADLLEAKSIAVTDDAGYEDAGRTRLDIDARRKRAEQIDELVCKPLYDHWKTLKGLFKPSIELRVQAAKILGDKRIAFDRAKQAEAERIRKIQEEAARKEQARLDALALERAEAAERKAREEAEKAAAIRRKAELEAAQEKDAARAAEILRQAEAAAAKAEAKSDAAAEKASQMLETVPQVVIPMGPAYVAPKTQGIAKQEYFWAEVVDFQALVTAVAAGEVPLDAILPNEAWLTKTAKALQKNMQYPGVAVKSEWRERGTGR